MIRLVYTVVPFKFVLDISQLNQIIYKNILNWLTYKRISYSSGIWDHQEQDVSRTVSSKGSIPALEMLLIDIPVLICKHDYLESFIFPSLVRTSLSEMQLPGKNCRTVFR
jgi:hypothetical protein